jgi:hypothetical protein
MQKRGSTLSADRANKSGQCIACLADGFSLYAFISFHRNDIQAGIFSIRSPYSGVRVLPGADLVISHRSAPQIQHLMSPCNTIRVGSASISH